MSFLSQTWYLTVRLIRRLLRQPWYIALTLVQPIIWLTLYGQLFKHVVELPGFHAASYIDFLTPGIVVMSSLFASGWSGMGVIIDLDHGVMDRFLVSPVSRPAVIFSRLLNLSIITLIQSLILFTLGAILGARYTGGITGLLVLLLAAVLLATGFGALSIALGFALRKQESVIGAVNFVLLPLTFTSPVFMANGLMPGWMRTVAQVNPVNWSVVAGRAALSGAADWRMVGLQLLFLCVFCCFCIWLSLRAFRAHQRAA